MILDALFCLFLPIYLGLVSRWHGGGFFYAPKIIKTFAWGFPFGIVAFLLSAEKNIWIAMVFALITCALCMIGKASGHGNGIDLGTNQKTPYTPEKIERLVFWFKGKISDRSYDVLILALSGFLAVSGGVLFFAYSYPVVAPIISVCGLFKARAYIVGWKMFPHGNGEGLENFNEATQIGEFLTGVYAGAGLSMAYIICYITHLLA